MSWICLRRVLTQARKLWHLSSRRSLWSHYTFPFSEANERVDIAWSSKVLGSRLAHGETCYVNWRCHSVRSLARNPCEAVFPLIARIADKKLCFSFLLHGELVYVFCFWKEKNYSSVWLSLSLFGFPSHKMVQLICSETVYLFPVQYLFSNIYPSFGRSWTLILLYNATNQQYPYSSQWQHGCWWKGGKLPLPSSGFLGSTTRLNSVHVTHGDFQRSGGGNFRPKIVQYALGHLIGTVHVDSLPSIPASM